MELNDHYYLGRILKPIGVKGNMLIFLDVDDPDQYKNLDAVFVFVGGNLVPFLIKEIQLRPGKQAQVVFQDITSMDQTDILIGAGLYLPLAALPKLGENQFYFHEITGYKVIDEEFGEIGVVEKVLEYPKQALLQIIFGKKEILIPIADEIIHKVDKENRIIHISTPNGLIELYLD